MGRAPCCDKANVKKGPWSPEEDAKLKSYIEKHGTGGNWIALPHKIGLKRCGKSCRLRWLNYLRPNIKHGGFTEDEDNLICSLYVSIGSRWSIIAAQLPGRTDNDIKNYWNTKLKKKLLGKQHTQRQSAGTSRRCDQSYSNTHSFSSYPRLVGYAIDENSDSHTNTFSVMPQIEANFSYDRNTQPINQGKMFEPFHCISDASRPENQQVCKNSACTSFVNCSCPPLTESDMIRINLPTFGDSLAEGMYDSMPQLLGGLDDSFSAAIDIVDSSTISSSSLETASWGDTSCIAYYPQSAAANYETCHNIGHHLMSLGY